MSRVTRLPMDPEDYPDAHLLPILYVKDIVTFKDMNIKVGNTMMLTTFIAIFTGLQCDDDGHEGMTHILCVPIIFYGESAEFLTNLFKGLSIWVPMQQDVSSLSHQWSIADMN